MVRQPLQPSSTAGRATAPPTRPTCTASPKRNRQETTAIATSGRLIRASTSESTAERQTARYGARLSSWLAGGLDAATVVIARYRAALRSTDHWASRIASPTAHGTPITAQRFAGGGALCRIAAARSAPWFAAASSSSLSSCGGTGGPPATDCD